MAYFYTSFSNISPILMRMLHAALCFIE